MKKLFYLLTLLFFLGCTTKSKLRETTEQKEDLKKQLELEQEERKKKENLLKITEEENRNLQQALESSKKELEQKVNESTNMFIEGQGVTMRLANGTEVNMASGKIFSKAEAERMWRQREETLKHTLDEEYSKKFTKDSTALVEHHNKKIQDLTMHYERELKQKNQTKEKKGPSIPIWIYILGLLLVIGSILLWYFRKKISWFPFFRKQQENQNNHNV